MNKIFKSIFLVFILVGATIFGNVNQGAYDQEKICIHKYLPICKTNPRPPGFGDFLRGTITLFEFSKIYNYKLYIDSEVHPLFGFLKDNEYFIKNNHDPIVYELIPGTHHSSYDSIYGSLRSLFERSESFSVITNSFYTLTSRGLENYGNITPACKLFLRNILTPSDDLRYRINEVYHSLSLDLNKGYTVIHLRLGDNFLHYDGYDENIFNNINAKIKELIDSHPFYQFVLLSDSSRMAIELKKHNPSLFYWNNKKIHLGDLRNNPEGIQDTLIDFFIMSKSDAIYSLNYSGFSVVISLIFDIEYNFL